MKKNGGHNLNHTAFTGLKLFIAAKVSPQLYRNSKLYESDWSFIEEMETG